MMLGGLTGKDIAALENETIARPCPFCGNRDVIASTNRAYRGAPAIVSVVCVGAGSSSCGAAGPQVLVGGETGPGPATRREEKELRAMGAAARCKATAAWNTAKR